MNEEYQKTFLSLGPEGMKLEVYNNGEPLENFNIPVTEKTRLFYAENTIKFMKEFEAEFQDDSNTFFSKKDLDEWSRKTQETLAEDLYES